MWKVCRVVITLNVVRVSPARGQQWIFWLSAQRSSRWFESVWTCWMLQTLGQHLTSTMEACDALKREQIVIIFHPLGGILSMIAMKLQNGYMDYKTWPEPENRGWWVIRGGNIIHGWTRAWLSHPADYCNSVPRRWCGRVYRCHNRYLTH